MKRYVIDEDNLRYLRNIRVVFTAKSTQDITIEQVYLYDNDVSDTWFEVSEEYLKDRSRVEKLENAAEDYLESLLGVPQDYSDKGMYGDKRY